MSSVPVSLSIARMTDAQRGWRMAGAVVAVLAGVFLMYWPSATSLIQLWGDTGKTTYTHGFIIAALAVWLVIRRRGELAALSWSPSIRGSLLVVAVAVVWLVAVRAGIELVHQLLLLALLWLSTWAVFGAPIALRLWRPIGYLVFAIPVWDQINFLLQAATVKAVAFLLAVSSIPAYVDGNIVHLVAGVFEVAGGCSGIHFLIVSLALAALYGEVGNDSWKVRVRLVAMAGALALLTNWMRVYIIIVAGYLTDMQHTLIRNGHYNFGWMLFAGMMIVFFLLARRFAPAAQKDSPALSREPAPASRGLGLAIALGCVAAGPAWDFLQPLEPAMLPATHAILRRAPPEWSRNVPSEAAEWNPVFQGADRIERADFVNANGAQVEVFVASYATQRQNKELVNYANSIIGTGDGEIVSSASASSGGVARELIVQGGHQRSVVRYFYDIGGYRTERGIAAQLHYGVAAMWREPVSSVVALRAVCASDCTAAQAVLDGFAASIDAN